MFRIDSIIAMLINFIFDIRDAINNGRDLSLTSNTIKLECVVSDDLPMDLRNEYCHSLEVVYATLIRNLLNPGTRNRFDSNPMSIFRSIPVLTAYDPVSFNKKIKGWISTSDWIFNRSFTGNKPLDVFTESMLQELDKALLQNPMVSLENDVILKESRGAVSTYVDIGFLVNTIGGGTTEKKFSIGVQVIPKVVSREEMIQFFVKQNTEVLQGTGSAGGKSFWDRVKAVFTFRKRAVEKEIKTAPKEVQKTFYECMKSVQGIKKPFVAILTSNIVAESCAELGVDILKNATAQKIYDKFPVISIGVYDTNSDTITASLTQDSQFVTRGAGEFNSEISRYEKEFREMIRVNRMA